MYCANCKTKTAYEIRQWFENGKTREYCNECNPTGYFNKGFGQDLRVWHRIDDQQRHHGADLVQPHVYDKMSRKNIPNPDFVKLYPEHAAEYYTPKEMKRNMGKWKKPDEPVEYSGDATKRAKEVLT